MGTALAMPFRTVAGSVRPGAWHFRAEEGTFERLDGMFPAWDYNAYMHLHTEVEIDREGVLLDCGLHGDTRLQLLVVVSCPATYSREVVLVSEAIDGTNVVSFDLNSERFSGQILIELLLVPSTILPATVPFAAEHPGSILFLNEQRLVLEPDVATFAIHAIPFSGTIRDIPAGGVPWHLEWSGFDPALPARDQLVLLLNSECPEFVDAVRSGGESMEVRLLRSQVAELVLMRAISDQAGEWLDDPGHDPGSLGDFVTGLKELCFPGQSHSELQTITSELPNEFQLRVRARLL